MTVLLVTSSNLKEEGSKTCDLKEEPLLYQLYIYYNYDLYDLIFVNLLLLFFF
jgi:hypothetical protein